MRNITIGFSKSALKVAPFSWLIMAVQHTPYSHAYIKIHCTEIDRDIYYQASHSMVNFMSSDQFQGQEMVIKEFTFQMPDDEVTKVSQLMYEQLGKPYGVMEIIGLAAVVICGWFGKKIQNPVKDGPKEFYCSELVAYFLEQCEGIELPKDLEDMTPLDLYNFVQTIPPVLKLKA